MILVVEGPSAVGKTTWSSQWPPRSVVPENGHAQPEAAADRDEIALLYVELNCSRWERALATEAATGLAICDTDPLKLHYHYCLARAGHGSWEQFTASATASRAAIADERLGMADLVLCAVADDVTLERRERSDPSRARSNFAINRRLGPALRDWYRTLEQLSPQRVA